MLAPLIAALFFTPAQLPIPPLPPLPPVPPIPCIPLPAMPCYQPPPAPPLDEPPKLTGTIKLADRTKLAVTLRWKPAVDDKGIVRYLIFRDGRLIASLPPTTTRLRVKLRCGRHVYALVALDAFAQRAVKTLRVRRRC